MLNAKAFANAVTIVTAVFYIICAALSYFAPDLIFSISRSWMHTVSLESVKTAFNPDLGTLIWGIVTISVLSWITAYATIYLYNSFKK